MAGNNGKRPSARKKSLTKRKKTKSGIISPKEIMAPIKKGNKAIKEKLKEREKNRRSKPTPRVIQA